MTEIKEYDGYVIHVLLPAGMWDLAERRLWVEFTADIKDLGGDVTITDPIPVTAIASWKARAGSRRI
jgi:hypothetical protein